MADKEKTHPKSLQEEILDRTWEALKAEGLDAHILEQLRVLVANGQISHVAKLVAALGGNAK